MVGEEPLTTNEPVISESPLRVPSHSAVTPVIPEPVPVITPTTDIPEGVTSNDLVPPATTFT